MQHVLIYAVMNLVLYLAMMIKLFDHLPPFQDGGRITGLMLGEF